MNVYITGASGLIGTAVAQKLRAENHRVIAMVRRSPKLDEVQWTPGIKLGPSLFADADVVIHLAGTSIAARWSERTKREIRDSRVLGTTTIAEAVAASFAANGKPKTMLSASAIGFYGDRGNEALTESSGPGAGFLPQICQLWESAAAPARQVGVRVVHLRIGLVLTRQGGALPQMLLPFRLGLGGRIGSGRQYWSWIALPDVVRAVLLCAHDDNIAGPVNLTSPQPVTNREFTKALGAVLKRPTILPVPRFAARLAIGEGVDELLLASARVMPRALQKAGFEFRYPELRFALEAALASPSQTENNKR